MGFDYFQKFVNDSWIYMWGLVIVYVPRNGTFVSIDVFARDTSVVFV